MKPPSSFYRARKIGRHGKERLPGTSGTWDNHSLFPTIRGYRNPWTARTLVARFFLSRRIEYNRVRWRVGIDKDKIVVLSQEGDLQRFHQCADESAKDWKSN
jgi:hypothetical protein